MLWEGVVTDRTGAPLGELREASGRGFKKSLNRGRATRWTVQVDNPLARWHQDDTVLVKWYQDNVLRFVGGLVTSEKNRDGAGGTIAVTAGDAFATILPWRLLGKSNAGQTYATAVSPQDKGALAAMMITEANASGDTGIRMGTVQPSSNGFAGPYWYQPADAAITDLSAGLGGFDWDLVPVEPVADAGGIQTGRLDIYSAVGTVRDDVAFEFGTGKRNVASFRDLANFAGRLNRGYSLPPGFPDNATQLVLTQADAASIAQRGVFEGTVAGDLQVDALRQALLDQNIAVRKLPQRVITFVPITEDAAGTPIDQRRVPRALLDYDVGDVVHFRAKERFKRYDPTTGAVIDMVAITTVDALFRVFAIDVAIGDNGDVTVTVTLVQE